MPTSIKREAIEETPRQQLFTQCKPTSKTAPILRLAFPRHILKVKEEQRSGTVGQYTIPEIREPSKVIDHWPLDKRLRCTWYLVEWADGTRSWEEADRISKEIEATVFEYWRHLHGNSSESRGQFEVEYIVSHVPKSAGGMKYAREYLIKYVGFSSLEWQKSMDLQCQEKIEHYWSKLQKAFCGRGH